MSRHVRFHKPPLIQKNEKAKAELVEEKPVKEKPKTVKRPAKKKK